MNKIQNYLNILNEGTDFNDSSMPNPYDYQSLELDSNVTNSDLNHLGDYLKKMKKYLDPEMNMDPYIWLYFGANYKKEYGKHPPVSWSHQHTFTIIDNNKRVGIVAMGDFRGLVWSSWIPGYKYSVRGVMKMIDNLLKDKTIKFSKNLIPYTKIHKNNIPSLKTALLLKMKIERYKDHYVCKLNYPFWFIEKKKWFN